MEPSSTSSLASAFPLAAARAYRAALRVRNGARAGQRNGPAPAAAPPPLAAARRQPSRICAKTVMDESDPDIVFDADGVSNWWHDYQVEKAKRPDEERQRTLLDAALAQVREAGRGKPYDCVLGVSGGVDSSYVAYLARLHGLRPLLVHFDNGWNDELAVHNIEKIVKTCGYRLHTFVMDWPEFRDLQRAYFKAGVLDLEVPTDHMIFGALHQVARRHGIGFVLSGTNFATEWLLPRAWHYSKRDLVNLRAIHRTHGEAPMKKLPKIGIWQQLWYQRVQRIREVDILDLVPYRKGDAMRTLEREFGWTYYGGKHYESVFTRFYQGYILPTRFGIDKRKAHFSNLILNGEMTRDEALAELAKPTYDPRQQQLDKQYVAKKLGWSPAEFDEILARPRTAHEAFGTDLRQRRLAELAIRCLHPLARLVRGKLRR
jgi:N-acetyl sugar amidotransferase